MCMQTLPVRTQDSPTLLDDKHKQKLLDKLNRMDDDKDKMTDKDRLTIGDRIDSRLLKKLFEKRFVDQAHSVRYAKEHIYCFRVDKKTNKPVDPDFEFQDQEDPVVVSQVMDCLVVMAKIAKEHKAAILIPNYTMIYLNSKLIENALDYVDFDGPVISISAVGCVACDETSAGEMYHAPGDLTGVLKGLLLNRATHSIQVLSGSYSLVAARLASVIAIPYQELFNSDYKTKNST
jgi:hypothetical protein